jgi:hypothetical protein
MYFDRHDICAAYRLYATFYGGDGYHYANAITCRLSRLNYRDHSTEKLEGLSDNAREIYAKLVRRCEPKLIAMERFLKRYRKNAGRRSNVFARFLYASPYRCIWVELTPNERRAVESYAPSEYRDGYTV